MAKRRKAWYITSIMVTVFWTLLAGANVSAEPGSASPFSDCDTLARGPQGTLKGKGGDEKVLASTVLEPESVRAIMGSVDTPGTASGVAVIGEKAYVADGLWGLQVIDVSDPRNPTIIGSVDTPGTASGVAVIGEKAYVADGLWGLQVIDVSDPRNPTIIGSVDTPGAASGVTVIGEKAYVADHDKGLAICSLAASGDRKGDVNGDDTVDLTDAILALQGLAGLESAPPVTVAKDADVNGDGRIGLEEAIYVIHKVAGVRP